MALLNQDMKISRKGAKKQRTVHTLIQQRQKYKEKYLLQKLE
jgi:hypothetical protein